MSAFEKTRIVAGAIDAARFDQRVLRFAAMGAGVHAQGAADGAGNAAIEGEAVDARVGRRARGFHIWDSGADAQTRAVFDDNFAKALRRETDDNAFDAAVAHDEIGAKADDRDGNFTRQMRKKIGEIGFVRRQE